ncbi:MAG: phage portal protein [Streptosporangiaceae bacterium]
MAFTGLDLPFDGAPVTGNMLTNTLPAGGKEPWPPLRFSPVHRDQRLWSAWWSGNPDELQNVYSLTNGGNSPIARSWSSTTGEAGLPSGLGRNRPGLWGVVRRWFWGNVTPEGERRTNYHVPLAGDLASTSANLLFGQPPTLKYEGDTRIQDYLSGLVDDGTQSKLMEAAEGSAALGGVYLRVVWDTDISDKPWIDEVPADCAVPEFRYGKLTAVTFWSVIRDEGKDVVRHLEKHIPGQNAILHGVYHGSQKELGRPMQLTDFEETAPYASAMTDGNAITFPDAPRDASTVVYVPNMRPNRIWRQLGPQASPLGRSDFSGVEGLMDALDETMSSWMRDIRVGKARLIVPQSNLQTLGRGQGAILDLEREVMVPIGGLVTGEGAIGQQILPQQFSIRWQEHQNTCQALIETIITQAGYSGQTLGLQGDIAQTATEVVARERKSLTTRGKKVNYWRPAMADIIYGLMAIDATVFGSRIEPVRPDVEWPDAVLPDQLELAQTVAAMRGAEAASIETAVATMHPDWKPDDVALEVKRIYEEINIDLLSRARIAIGGAPGESVAEDLASIPAAIGSTDVQSQAEQLADVSDMYDAQSESN